MKVNIEVPKNLTKKQKELLKNFAASMEENSNEHYQKRKSFFQKMKDALS